VGGTTGGVGGTTGGVGGTTGGMGGTTGGMGGTTGGVGGTTGGTGGTTGGTGGTTGGTTGGMGGIGAGDCTGLPPVTDYNAKGPFDAKMYEGVGPNMNYTLFRPDTSLGKDGFKHPIGVWGNGILTIPNEYQQTMNLIASHGFVIIGCNDIQPERACVNAGIDWLVEQNTAADSPMKGKLDLTREVAVGYSWGGGAAIDTSNRPNIKATVSLHGMPPREMGAFDKLHAPLLLFTSTGDGFVSASGFVTPNYEASNKVPTFYATLNDNTVDHLWIVDEGATACVASIALGSCGSAKQQRGPTLAWFRYWACGDQGAKKHFFGADCALCKSPWTAQKKPAASFQ
jgi:hypothetical protein